MKSKKKNQGRRPVRSREDKKKQRFGKRKFEKENHGSKKLRAIVDKNRNGFAFLIFEKKDKEDAFVPPRAAERLFPGDRVEVTLGHRGQVQHIEVLKHRFSELVGKFIPHPRARQNEGWVVYEKKSTHEEIFIPKSEFKAKGGDWVRVKLHFHEKGPYAVSGEILEVYGKTIPPSADLPMIAAEYGLEEEHSHLAEKEARDIGTEVSEKSKSERKDLRNVPFITIDGETARDFDDAVFVEKQGNKLILWVAIADVSYYVKRGSHLDQSAYGKGTSVYFPEKAFHMLPRTLSENLCSLKPNEPRLALVCKMHFDENGKRNRTEVMEGLIQSKRRATYNEIQKEFEQNQNNPAWEFASHFALYRKLRKMRTDRGSIDFELPEAETVVAPTGEVISIQNRPRLDAHRLIEEFMIAANEAVTVWMMERKWPFVYRVHQEPSLEALEKFQGLAASVGVQFSIEKTASPKVIADLVRNLEGNPAQVLLNMALLRSMKQAVYSSTHGIHFGLASQAYTHFTSPIRRYPDLVVHRLIRMVLRDQSKKPRLNPQQRDQLEKELTEICEHCSYRERLASDAERESIKLKQVRVMSEKLGEEFDGSVVGMIGSGLFIRLSNPYVEGLVPIDSMNDDVYEWNEDRMVFFGKRTKRTFKIGDPVRIRVVRADLERRQIDFVLVRSL